MGIIGLYNSISVDLYGSGSAGLYDSGVSGPMKVYRNVTGEWMCACTSRLLGSALLALEDSETREDGWGKGSFPVRFRVNRSNEGGRRGKGEWKFPCDHVLLRTALLVL